MIKRAHVLGTASAAALIVAMGGIEPVHAQSAPKDNSSVESVTVTGYRVKENIQTVSAAISALSAEQLQTKNVIQISDLQYATPSLSITDAGLSQNVNIRGIGLSSGSPAVTPGVPIYLDGLVQPPVAFSNSFYDIRSVEVYRGPQGIFAGASSTGGAVFVNSNSPNLDKLGGSIDAWGGDYWSAGLQGAVNVPLTDTVAFRAAFNLERRDSFYENIGPTATPTGVPFNTPGKLSEQDVRLSFLWQPLDSLTVLVKLSGSEKNTDGYAAIPRAGSAAAATLPPDMVGKRVIDYDTQQLNTDRTTRNVLDVNYVFPGGITIRSVTGYQENVVKNVYDTDATSVPSLMGYETQDVAEKPFSQEFNIISPDSGNLKWVLGYFYYHDIVKVGLKLGGVGFDFAPTQTHPGYLDITIHTTKQTQAVFGRVQYNIIPDLQLEVGGRLEQNWSHLRQINNGYGAVGDPPVPLIPFTSTDDENRWSGEMWTGKVGVNYNLNDNNFLYVFASKGSKVGGASIGYTFKPETVIDYEAGWKSTLLDGALVVQLAGFYAQYSNFQVDGLNPVNGLNSTFNVTDATTFNGIEAQVFGNFGHLRFDAGASWVQSSVGSVTLVNTSDPVLAADITAHSLTGGLGPQCAAAQPSNPPVCYDYSPYLLSMSGKRNPYAPTWNFNAGIEYTFELGGDTTLTPRIDYSLQSGQWTTLWEIPSSDWIDGHDLWNFRATLNHGQWSLATYVTNLADTTFITGQFLNTAYLNAPRQFGARLSYRF